ncbi:unnamed protein product [Effrenium voratum]|nr:unnamed protein product [Effrenium voratum]
MGGLRNQMNHAAEALTWCRARLDAAHAKRAPRVGFGQEGWKESMKETAFSRKQAKPLAARGRSKGPMAKHRALLRRLEHLQQSPKDPELRIPKVLQQERSPMRRFDTWADKSGDEMHGFNARSLEVKKQMRATASRRRTAEQQAEMARVTPCSAPNFTRTRLVYSGVCPIVVVTRRGLRPEGRPQSAMR